MAIEYLVQRVTNCVYHILIGRTWLVRSIISRSSHIWLLAYKLYGPGRKRRIFCQVHLIVTMASQNIASTLEQGLHGVSASSDSPSKRILIESTDTGTESKENGSSYTWCMF